MIIKEVYIYNYRNFKEITVPMEEFNVIIGKNNIGKTNFLKAINLVLNPNLSYRRVFLDIDDFCESTKEMIIRITLGQISAKDEEVIPERGYDPEMKEMQIQFKAKWDSFKNEVKPSCCVIDVEPDSDEHTDFHYNIKKNYPYFIIDAIRQVEKEMNNRKGDLRYLLDDSIHEFMISLTDHRKSIELNLDNLKIALEKNVNETDLLDRIKSLQQLFTESDFDKFKTRFIEYRSKLNSFFSSKTLSDEQVDEIESILSEIDDKLSSLKIKIESQNKIINLQRDLESNTGFIQLNDELKRLFKYLLPVHQVDFSFIALEEHELFRYARLNVDKFDILSHGIGFQFNLILIIKLLRIIRYSRKNKLPSVFIAIEEPESHISPHLQRQFISNLKSFTKFYEDIEFQFIITSHSSEIVKKMNVSELILFRNTDEKTIATCLSKNFTNEIVDKFMENWQNKNKSKNLTAKKIGEQKQRRTRSVTRMLDNLINHNPDAFFADMIVLGEGDSEEGALPLFAKTLEKDLDKLCITYVSLNGKTNIFFYENILENLQIDYCLIIDKDNNENLKDNSQRKFTTERKDFEEEIYESCSFSTLFEIFSIYLNDEMKELQLNKLKKKMKIDDIDEYDDFREYMIEKADEKTEKTLKEHFKDLLKEWKGFRLGLIIGEIISKEEIPESYKEFLLSVSEKGENND